MAVLESRTAVRRGAYLLIEPETGDGCTREPDGCQAWCVPSH